jgi:hypothetical protein
MRRDAVPLDRPAQIRVQHRPLSREAFSLSETRKYRQFTAEQKTEIVLASLRGPQTMAGAVP